MKKVAGVSLTLFIIFFSLFTFSYAQEEDPLITPAPVEEIQYTFAYPGILPDNPLHFLKAGRDRIIGFLINDAARKAEFNLLTSDKRVYASQMLLEKGKDALTVTTLSKSNNYLHEAINSAGEARRMGKNVDTVLSNLENGIKKREEVFLSMREKIDEEFQNGLETEIKRLGELKKNANDLSSE